MTISLVFTDAQIISMCEDNRLPMWLRDRALDAVRRGCVMEGIRITYWTPGEARKKTNITVPAKAWLTRELDAFVPDGCKVERA